eukprot:SAG31_NODE_5487_length_2511_cov_6.334577_2_plen_491_part_00
MVDCCNLCALPSFSPIRLNYPVEIEIGHTLRLTHPLFLVRPAVTNVENPQPVSTETVFPIASISKTVAATALLRLHDQGLVDVEATVQTYLPNLSLPDDNAASEVRLWHLLTHTPGWEGQLDTIDKGSDTLKNFVEQTLSRENLKAQLARPGEVWGYNNAGWGLAGRVIEVVTGQTIGEALHDLVFAPLGLERACSSTAEAASYRFAAPHTNVDDETMVIRPFSLPVNVSAGGCAMSIEDLLQYALFHLGDGKAKSGARVLSEQNLKMMQAARVTKNSTEDQMGLGWHLRTLHPGCVKTCQHGGSLAGHCLHVQLVPERQVCFAILTNHSDGWKLNEDVASAILELEDLRLLPGQRTGGNRGGNERMTRHASPLAEQPPLAEYLGRYVRPPSGDFMVTQNAGQLVLVARSSQGEGDQSARDPKEWGTPKSTTRVLFSMAGADGGPLLFYGDDVAYASESDGYAGLPVEFIRDASGAVKWIRVNGRIARKK